MGKLYLLPNLLDESLNMDDFLPKNLQSKVQEIQGLIAESEKMGRRYLRKFLSHEEMAKRPTSLPNEPNTPLSLIHI